MPPPPPTTSTTIAPSTLPPPSPPPMQTTPLTMSTRATPAQSLAPPAPLTAVGEVSTDRAVVGPNMDPAAVEGPNMDRAVVEGPNMDPAVVEGPNMDPAVVEGLNMDPAAVEGPNMDRAAEGLNMDRAAEGPNMNLAAEGLNMDRAVEGPNTVERVSMDRVVEGRNLNMDPGTVGSPSMGSKDPNMDQADTGGGPNPSRQRRSMDPAGMGGRPKLSTGGKQSRRNMGLVVGMGGRVRKRADMGGGRREASIRVRGMKGPAMAGLKRRITGSPATRGAMMRRNRAMAARNMEIMRMSLKTRTGVAGTTTTARPTMTEQNGCSAEGGGSHFVMMLNKRDGVFFRLVFVFSVVSILSFLSHMLEIKRKTCYGHYRLDDSCELLLLCVVYWFIYKSPHICGSI